VTVEEGAPAHDHPDLTTRIPTSVAELEVRGAENGADDWGGLGGPSLAFGEFLFNCFVEPHHGHVCTHPRDIIGLDDKGDGLLRLPVVVGGDTDHGVSKSGEHVTENGGIGGHEF